VIFKLLARGAWRGDSGEFSRKFLSGWQENPATNAYNEARTTDLQTDFNG
jgi:hypothetical protein